MTFAVPIPIPISTIPSIAPKVIIVCNIPFMSSLLFCPIMVARDALGPTERPTIRLTKIPTSATQLPTAAIALPFANLPTTATSAELKSCCKILLNANGMANIISLPAVFPFNISSSFVFLLLIYCCPIQI